MASTARVSAPPLPAVQRYFEVSLFLLVSTGIFAVVSTGKLDIFSTVIPVVVLVYKAGRLWRGRGPEISVRTATGLVLAYFLFSRLTSGCCRAPCRRARRTPRCIPRC